MTKKIGQSKRRFVEDDLVANKEKEMKDLFPDNNFAWNCIDGINYVSVDLCDKLVQEGKAQRDKEVEELRKFNNDECERHRNTFYRMLKEKEEIKAQTIKDVKGKIEKCLICEVCGDGWIRIKELLSQLDDDSQECTLKEMSEITSANKSSPVPDTQKGFTDKELYESTLGIPWDRKEKGLCKEYGYHVIGCDCNREKPIIKNDNIIEGLLK